jgi:hypothetical protein
LNYKPDQTAIYFFGDIAVIIKWKTDGELQIMENEVDSYTEIVRAGQTDDVDIVGENEDSVDMQFGCGDVAFSISRETFEIIEE